MRNCLMAKLGGENTQLLEIAQDERARAARTAQLFTEEELTRNLQIALRTFDELNYRQEQRFHLELGLLKLIQAQRLLPMEEILSSLSSQSSGKRANSLPSPPSSPARTSSVPTSRPAPAAPPSISPFAASNQRAESSIAAREREPIAATTPISQPAPIASLPPEPITNGALAPSEPEEQPIEIQASAESGPQIVPPQIPPSAAASENDTDAIRTAVAQTLTAGGHATAAVLIEDGKWTIEGSSVRIEVNAKPTMIRITFNAAAEKLIRQALTQAGAPSRFMIVPGEGLTSSNGPAKNRAPQGSIENEARTNPLVVQAQSLFNAEIVTVVDLRT
jgi:DNA polymerase-3 subunit gamma/tau